MSLGYWHSLKLNKKGIPITVHVYEMSVFATKKKPGCWRIPAMYNEAHKRAGLFTRCSIEGDRSSQ